MGGGERGRGGGKPPKCAKESSYRSRLDETRLLTNSPCSGCGRCSVTGVTSRLKIASDPQSYSRLLHQQAEVCPARGP